jgi:hypothetical protein
MSTPLTEERFLEIIKVLDTRLSTIEADIKELKKDVAELKKDVAELKRDMITVKGFQKYEAEAIEFELQELLTKHLTDKYQLFTISLFKMKRLYDPITYGEITELDAAFLITPVQPKRNYSRLIEAGVRPAFRTEVTRPSDSIFVLAEAKHHINLEKISIKLGQFDRIIRMFRAAHDVATGSIMGYNKSFIETVRCNKYMGKITKWLLFFGAAYWEKGIRIRMQDAVKIYKQLSEEFSSATNERKLDIYNKMYTIEKDWYENVSMLTPDTVHDLKEYGNALKYVEFIIPCGGRYCIPTMHEPVAFLIGGERLSWRKTYKYIHR